MRYDVLTLFPKLLQPWLELGVTRRAFQSGLIQVHVWDIRAFASGRYRRVDDRPFGGGPGMVMLAEPLALAIEAVFAARGAIAPVLYFCPDGLPLKHAVMAQWASDTCGAVLLCGRYEGVDQRLLDRFVTHRYSLGDFVLSGGELAALALLDGSARLIPGVLGGSASPEQDSFHPHIGGLLDCPHYTRPAKWRGEPVPAVLMGGNHAAIDQWRSYARRHRTQQARPDLCTDSAALQHQQATQP